MGYLMKVQNLPSFEQQVKAEQAVQTVVEALPPGTILAMVASYHDQTYSVMIKNSPQGQFTSVGIGGGVFEGGEHAQSILEGLICAAVFHGGQVSIAANTGQWQVLF